MRFEKVEYDQTPEELEKRFKDMIERFIAQRGSTPALTHNEIQVWQQQNADAIIMKASYDSEKKLDYDWDIWCAMDYDDKVGSDTMAIKLYGMDNSTIYNGFKTIFLRKTSQNPASYDPSLVLYSQQNNILKDMIQGVKSDSAIPYQISEAYEMEDNTTIANLNKQAFDAMRQSGYAIVTAGANSIEELNKQYYNYQSMSRDKRSKADTYSLQIYGMDNEQHYKEQFVRLHNPDFAVDTPPFTIDYQPTDESSNLFSLNAILDHIHDTDDLIEAATMADIVKKDIKPSTIVEETLLKVIDDEVDKKAKKLEDEQPLGFTPYFFLPDEIEELGAYSEDSNLYGKSAPSGDISPNTKDWLYSYYAKALGLRPPMRWSNSRWRGQVELLSNRLGDPKLDNNLINSTKQSLLEIGWNPEVKYDQSIEESISVETNKRFLEDFSERYQFLDITEAASKYDEKVRKISKSDTPILNFYFFSTTDDVGAITSQEVYIGLDINDEYLYPIVDGLLRRRVENFEDIVSHANQDTNLKVYSIGMAKTDADKIQDVVHRYSVDLELSKYSMINAVLRELDIPMIIENEKLFCAYILDMIVFLADNPGAILEPISMEEISSKHIRRRSLRHVYLTYSGKADEYTINPDNRQHFFGKFVKYSIAEDCNPCSSIKVTKLLQEVTTLPIEFDKDGNLFIKKKENINFAEEYAKCHKLLVQYSKAKGYEAMKYYVAKLWYMNILIEKRLHDKKKKYTKEQLTSWYNTRAHILADFKKYMGEILENEPNFDFEKYYSTTPFDKSILKVSNTFLRTVWNMFRSLLGFYVPSMPKK